MRFDVSSYLRYGMNIVYERCPVGRGHVGINVKELNFPNDYIYKQRRVSTMGEYDLFVFYDPLDSQNKRALFSIFQGQRVDRFLTDRKGWRKFFEQEKPKPTGFQIYSASTLIAASMINGDLSWNHEYCEDSALSGRAAGPLDADDMEAFYCAARGLDEDVLEFIRKILQQKSTVYSTDEKETRRNMEEKARLEVTGDLGPIFRDKREEDE